MHSYKLNNSYTVYVNYAYLNDCIKASKKKGHSVKMFASPKKQAKMMVNPCLSTPCFHIKCLAAVQWFPPIRTGL